jgi:hypothetical protein
MESYEQCGQGRSYCSLYTLDNIHTLSDGHKFKRRGNEEQFKHNKILSKIKEADNVLDANNPSQEGISKAKEKLAEGMSLLNYASIFVICVSAILCCWSCTFPISLEIKSFN